jgi:CRISPR-associated protein Csd1
VILPALIDYYDRLAAEPESDIAPFGFSPQNISFILVLEKDGSIHAVQSAQVSDEKEKLRPRQMKVPDYGQKRTAQDRPNFLWDKTDYLFGVSKDSDEPARDANRFKMFCDLHLQFESQIQDELFRAFCMFLKAWEPSNVASISNWTEVVGQNCVIGLRGEQRYLHELPDAQTAWHSILARLETKPGFCLTTGAPAAIARLHPPIKRVYDPGGQAEKGIVAFNKDKAAFESYGKEQSFNAPVSVEAAFKYCTALNRLLTDERRRVLLGGATIVFWSEKPTPFEEAFTGMIAGDKPEDAAAIFRTHEFFESLKAGVSHSGLGDLDTKFFVLGLSPNAARISIRYWLEGTVRQFGGRLRTHIEALEMVGGDSYPPLTIRRMVSSTARLDDGRPDYDSISPHLAGDITRAVLTGLPYPNQLLAAIIARIGADGVVDHPRASIIKGFLIRKSKEVFMALDTERIDPPYLLGRLFAALEKTQEDAYENKLNRTIKDAYFSSASANPASVFPRLCRLSQHHIERLEGSHKVNRERLIQDIIAPLGAFPRVLPLEEQGLFFIGYYHQRQAL